MKRKVCLAAAITLLFCVCSVPSAAQSADSSYIFQRSDTVRLTEEDLMPLDSSDRLNELRYARNEIFARKGYVFKNEELKEYFSSKSWYHPDPDFRLDRIGREEWYNIMFIRFYEEKQQKSYPYSTNRNRYTTYPAGESVSVDLNGDGKSETIRYSVLPSGYSLTVNGKTVQNDFYTNPAPSFAVVDIDKNDSYKEIAVSDYGPSDDYQSAFYSFVDETIIQTGTTGGLYEYGLLIDGTGTVTAMHRAGVLQTWFFDKQYALTGQHMLSEIVPAVYKTDYDLFVKKKIKLYSDKDETSEMFSLYEGQAVKVIGTDDRAWCQIKTASGKTGWIAVCNFSQIKNEESQEASVFFAGLCYAD